MTPRDKFMERAKQLFGVWFHEGSRPLPEVMADFAAAVERETALGCIGIVRLYDDDHDITPECIERAIRREYLEPRTEAQPR